ncbi:MAG: altronate dehydratase family protein [Firmicutes bacterium]|nr:altronate dehydratase family protein [Bacillota bacterium]
MRNAIHIDPADNVAVALRPLSQGQTTAGLSPEITASEDIPQGHKIAVRYIRQGEAVLKYGNSIGFATRDIPQGSHVHTQNVRTGLGEMLDYDYHPRILPPAHKQKDAFQGFLREDGRAGVRNDIWILPTVGCVNGIAQRLAVLAGPHVYGSAGKVIAFPHPYGCSQMGEDQDATRAILADLALHPNAGGVLLLGLGCENSGVEEIKPYLGAYDENRIRFLVCQEHEDELAAGLALLRALIDNAAKSKREPIATDKLIVGLKCGGSDGLSGITANPVIGGFSDRLIANGGSTILTEVPEMFGAETLLMARCETRALFEKTVSLINDFKRYYTDHHQRIYENPSPGNKAGGISTLEDKALGCTQKGGKAPVSGVLAYAERVNAPGLSLLSAPGNDLVAATALAAAGAQIVLFSTGRGTPFGCPVPTVKISSNTPLALRKRSWIDFDAGRAAEGADIGALAEELYAFVLFIASGQSVKHEIVGIHDMAIWRRGVTL